MIQQSREQGKTTKQIYDIWDDNEYALQSGWNMAENERFEEENNK